MLVKKLGQPVPLSYFIFDVNSGRLQPAQTNTPTRFSLLSGLLPGYSVPSSRNTWYCAGVNSWRQTVLLRSSGSVVSGTSASFASSVFQFLRRSSIEAGVLSPAAKTARAPTSATSIKRNSRRSIVFLAGLRQAFDLDTGLGF